MAAFISIKKTRGVEYVYLLENYIQEIDGVKKRSSASFCPSGL